MSSFIISESSLERTAKKLIVQFSEKILYQENDIYRTFKKYWDEQLVKEYMKFYKIKKFYKHSDRVVLYPSLVNGKELPEQYDDSKEVKEYVEKQVLKHTDHKFVYEFLHDLYSKFFKKVNEGKNFREEQDAPLYDKHPYDYYSQYLFEDDEDFDCLRRAFFKAYELFYISGSELV